MTKISAVIITFNEERNIKQCLESLIDVVDEIIVLDSFSTDQTESICRLYNVRFYSQEFRGFIQQKNDAVALASHDFVFSIDADEVVSAELKQSILNLKKQETLIFDAYIINRLTNYCGKWIRHCAWYPDYLIRLFDRRKCSFQGQYIHEKVVIPENSVAEKLSGDLLHYSYNSISEHIARANKYTDLTALEAFEKGKKASMFSILINPSFKFFRNYILKLGFLDGYYGYTVCRISAFATYLKYAKLRQIQKSGKDA